MKLSIITINYNNCEGLRETILSVVEQTCKQFEWIIVDGGSQDGSVALLEQYRSYFSYWCSETDKGIYNAMNKGLQHAHGDYCLFLNSGDRLTNNRIIEQVMHELSGDVWCARSFYHDGDRIWGKSRRLSSETFSVSTLARMSLPHQSTFIRTQLLHAYGGYDESYHLLADWALFMRVMLDEKAEFVFSDIFTSVYDTRGSSAAQKTLFASEKARVMLLIPAIYRKDIVLALSLQDVHSSSFGNFCYRVLYRMVSLLKTITPKNL